jgi:hypothetical protein
MRRVKHFSANSARTHAAKSRTAGQTTGIINPGVTWAGKYFQLCVGSIAGVGVGTGSTCVTTFWSPQAPAKKAVDANATIERLTFVL